MILVGLIINHNQLKFNRFIFISQKFYIAANIVSLLSPREPGLLETIRDAHAMENNYVPASRSTIDGMFAIINTFGFDRTTADIRPDEEMIQDDLFTRTYLQYPNSILGEFVFTIVNRRDSNDEWVILDTSYYPNTADVADRTPMRLLGDYYLDTLFYMTAKYAVQTEDNHRILNPGVYTATGTWADRVFFPFGVFFSHYA